MFRDLFKALSAAGRGAGVQPSGQDSSHWRKVFAGDDRSPETAARAYACMDPAEALDLLQTSKSGLTDVEAAARLQIAGPNVLTSTRPPPWWWLLLLVLPNPFNILLAFLAVISVATPGPNWRTFAVLILMVVISCAVRFWQEYRSMGAAIKLQNSVTTNVRVLRQPSETAQQRYVNTHEKNLVPGDVLLLSPGDSIAADCMILESNYLRVSQSSITGESIPVRKGAKVSTNGEKSSETIFDLENIVFMGTSVVSGSALAVVLMTGDDAFIATIMKQLAERREPNSFQKGIKTVSYMLIGFMLVMVPIVLAVSGKITGDWKNAALFSVSVAVGLVPEMLPAIVNTNLARGAYRLSKRKAIVKRLDSIQNLGAMTVLCSDKTGTLTKDEVVHQNSMDCTGGYSHRVFRLAYINAASQGTHGNNMDSAIMNFPGDASQPTSVLDHETVAVMPFTFERRRSTCIVRGLDGSQTLICKGAFDEVLALCSHIRRGTGEESMHGAARQALKLQASGVVSKGYRILLVATKQVPNYTASGGDDDLEDVESRMTLEGMLTFLDPARDDAAASVARLRALGVEVKVLTGDSLGAAVNVCQAISLAQSIEGDDVEAITGPELAELEGTDEFDAAVAKCKALAKLTPSQKGQVVASLRKAGHCVGMLGDGINDCVALRAADVGISVDSGARAAKDCADVILTEKGLDIIAESVRMGRVTHGNTIKYIKMVASSNFGNVFSILIASAWLPFTPMTSLQLLVQNLLYDISQIAIPWDRMDEDYVQIPRRWDSMDLLRFIVVLGPTSSTIDMCTFCLGWFYYGIQTTSDPIQVQLFQTHWFLQGLLTQTLIVHLLRTAKVPVVQSRPARVLVFSTVAIMLIGFCLPFIPPIRDALYMARPADSFIGFLAAELVAYCVEVQLVKMAHILVFKTWL